MYTLPKLPYDYSALEPYIDTQTMQIHHTKHHQAYVDNLNTALVSVGFQAPANPVDLMKGISQLPEAIVMAVRNNGGGHVNHSFFWETLAPGGSKEPSPKLLNAIQSSFQTGESAQTQFNFRAQFAKAAMSRFGSGWAWLGVKADKSLCITSTPNQDNPWMVGLVDCPCTPILGLDVWEHAYYLHYQNRRAEYVEAFWNIVNWSVVERRYEAAMAA